MKIVRYLVATLYLFSCILHIYWAIDGTTHISMGLMLFFGILYFLLGMLIMKKKKIAYWLGILPIIPIVMTLTKIDFKNLIWMDIWLPIKFAAVIGCILLITIKDQSSY